jgi:hypothetical protein
MGKSYKNKNKRNGGGPFPLKYYDPMASEPAAAPGRDLLEAMPPLGVRPKIGGKRRTYKKARKTRGGFVPSVMGNFIAAASKYIVPVALFAGYKLMTRKGKRASRRRHTRRRR